MFELALALGWGLLLGGINHWILARPLQEAAAAQGQNVDRQQAVMKKIYARFLLRMIVSLAGIGLAFVFWRDMVPLAATLAGLLVVNVLTLRQQRRKRGSTV